MTRSLGVRPQPREHLSQPALWPYGDDDGTVAAVYAQAFCQRLTVAIGSRSLRAAGRAAGVSHGTIGQVLRGQSWPDLVTIARLEWGLGTGLWPGNDLLAAELRRLRAEVDRWPGQRLRRPSAASAADSDSTHPGAAVA